MTDARRTPFDGQTALDHLRGQVNAARFVPGTAAMISAPDAGLFRSLDGGLDKVLLMGEPVTIVSEHGESAFVQSGWDDYVGYVARSALGVRRTVTHRVVARSSHLYPDADFKSPPIAAISIGTEHEGLADKGRFLETPSGYLPREHLCPVEASTPFLTTARALLGTPYLWGGNTASGIDCSGLVQMAARLSGRACPRDSDQQASEFGEEVPLDQLRAGDLVFWKGHVGLMLTETDLIHANAFHMAVAIEPLAEARARIGAHEFGEVTVTRRPNAV